MNAPAPTATPPELFGIVTANLALIVSACALAVAGLSVLFTALNYRRGGANVRLIVHTTINPEELSRPLLTVKAINGGLASVQLVNLYFRLKDMRGVEVNPYVDSGTYFLNRRTWISPGRYLSGKVPKVLKGYSQNLWSLPRVGLLESTEDGRQVKVRAVAQLAGNKKRVRSRWINMRVRPLVPLPKKGPDGETVFAELVERDDAVGDGVPTSDTTGGPPLAEADAFAKPEPPPIPDEVKKRINNGEQAVTFQFLNEQGEMTEGKVIAAPAGWRLGDPVPFETIKHFQFEDEAERDEQQGDDGCAEGPPRP